MIDYSELNYDDNLELDYGYQEWCNKNEIGYDGLYHYYGESLMFLHFLNYGHLDDDEIITQKDITYQRIKLFNKLKTTIEPNSLKKYIHKIIHIYDYLNYDIKSLYDNFIKNKYYTKYEILEKIMENKENQEIELLINLVNNKTNYIGNQDDISYKKQLIIKFHHINQLMKEKCSLRNQKI